MEREALFLHLNQLEQNLKALENDFDTVKRLAVQLVEENVSLKMENEKYKEMLEQDESVDQSFKENTLTSLYHDGFHVCNQYFGTHRHGEECLFCQEFLNRDE